MIPFDWSIVDSQSFGMGMLWCACCHLLIGIGDNLITAAFAGLERLGKKRRERRKATQKKEDQDHAR